MEHPVSVNPQTNVHLLQPAESPKLSKRYKVGSPLIQGISDEFIPAIVRLDQQDEVVQANDVDAIIMTQKLSQQWGCSWYFLRNKHN